MWNYVYFIAYLNWKDKQEHTGIESFVVEKIELNDASWFPFNKSRELEGLDEDENEKEVLEVN